MLDAAFLFGVLCAVAGACMGRRASFALLSSAALGLAFNEFGVPFILPLWMMIDLGVVLVIATGRPCLVDTLILALFVPLWLLYFVEGQTGYVGSILVSSAQMALTFPFSQAAESGRRLLQSSFNRDGGGMAYVAVGGR
jgi:hypothetical protein